MGRPCECDNYKFEPMTSCMCKHCENGPCTECNHVDSARQKMQECGFESLRDYTCNPRTGRGIIRCDNYSGIVILDTF